ncbi:MAG: signal recognition particle-docking protein FtsY [Candidatus Eisenbacteria bacterium]|nr:signal recognition particle-docking protein FtsY [Candidatus Eisenbacteria bacterium]
MHRTRPVKKSLSKLFRGLRKTRRTIVEGISGALSGGGLDEDALMDIEETLIQADLGVDAAGHLTDHLRDNASSIEDGGVDAARELLASELVRIVQACGPDEPVAEAARPRVVMVVGVNGAGKTTSIGKLASRLTAEGRTVMLAASDTFRAAAVEQLVIWGERSGADVVGGQEGGDPAAVAYDAVEAAVSRDVDVLLVDTAGRLHTQRNLMEELKKIRRVIERRLGRPPDEVLLVLDANTGQNALSQARLFHEALDLTGIILAKLDGTARGGIVIPIARDLGVSVRFVGVGEGIDDLLPFDAGAFARGLVEASEASQP